MEMLLDVYKRPSDARYPVVCLVKSPKQSIAKTRIPINASSTKPIKQDYEYKRCGV